MVGIFCGYSAKPSSIIAVNFKGNIVSEPVLHQQPFANTQSLKPLILTPGDPAGIGSEISLRAWLAGSHNIVLQGDIGYFREIADKAKLAINFAEYDAQSFAGNRDTTCHVLHTTWPVPPKLGTPDAANAGQIITAIEQGVAGVKKGQFSALVTNPIAKDSLYQVGFAYPGHTEFLAHLDGHGKRPVMMLANAELRVIPLTVHIPLSEVESSIEDADLSETLLIIGDGLKRYFGLARPHIAVAGLNPHAGEAGYLGRFEVDKLAPFLADFTLEDVQISGPYSADSLFHKEARDTYDAVLCMYHDQALIPVKTVDFFNSVNVTLGLDFIRTSPDHGTAFDRAARLNARPDSLIAAIKLAENMALNAHGN